MACRLALVLAMDVSSSVDAAEDRLQREGLANALLSPQVKAAFFVSPASVAIYIFEWSGRAHQHSIRDWTIISSPTDLVSVAASIRTSNRTQAGLPTAMGHALGHAAQALRNGPDCAFRTIDVAGDGPNNAGFGPHSVYATFPFENVIVNGLVISEDDTQTEDYFRNEVIRGAGAFVEVADGFNNFQAAMQRKLVRELSAQIVGQATQEDDVQG